MNITWVIRSFLDYHIPVFKALDQKIGHRLHVIFAKDFIPPRVSQKAEGILGPRAIGLSGEWKFGAEDYNYMANSLLSIRFHPGLMKAIKKSNPDILIGDGFFKWTTAALLYKIIHKIPIVVCYERTAHTERNAQWYRVAYRKFAMRWIDAMCCNGKLTGEYVKSLGFPEKNILYGHMAADTAGLQNDIAKVTKEQVLELKNAYNLTGVVFLYVGRFVQCKGITGFLKVWKKFSEDISNCQATLLLVGYGPQRNEVEELIKLYKLSNVRLTGFVNYNNLARYYKAADVFVIPTLEDNWSLVVPEAMACGLPILCSKYNGCWPELIHPDENGWVFDPLDEENTLQSLIICRENESRLTQMGQKSELIVDNYTPEKAADSILSACEIAIRNH
jgi:glycosyltransferase involved in cell wall biosynthesis